MTEATYEAPSGTRYSEIAEDLTVLSEAFGLGEVRECRFLSDGLMNGNWRLDTAEGSFALKRIMDVPLPLARRNLAVLSGLADDGLPVGRARVSSAGDAVVEVAGRGYCLSPWMEGSHLPGTALSIRQAADLGVLLGRIHRSLNEERLDGLLPPGPEQVAVAVTTPAEAYQEADRFLTLIAGLERRTAFDGEAAAAVAERKVLLEKYGHERPAGEVAVGPVGWTHGDVQHRNVLWRDGVIVGVIDWDRIRVRPFGEEVARTATVQFGGEDGFLDLERTSAFVAGYRSVVPIPLPALADAVERLWWKRMSDYWQLVFHYDRDDHSCDHLFLPAERFLAWWTERREAVQEAFAAMP
ncbi:phosphotransferase [Kitasatospora purpeofusca]|uniref:phosphotransferase n=1 Tax=Kitasatospora purpeofusca TaxID=67352 RepID=UPI0022582311|nr:phosphotransferase [Kitasatospora purpeofusca]MCX4753483.1 phosphotransferase [Kitasatospora purpeofusca]WSR32979.1 phosphotransferase [Kitasatospora purpeofusca]